MAKELSVNVNGVDYYIHQFKGEKAFLIKTRIARVLGKAINAVMADKEGVNPEELDITVFAKLAAHIFDALEPQDALKLVKDLLSETYKANLALKFDEEFAGNMSGVYKLVAEVIKLNYPDLFQMLGIAVE